MMELDDFMMSGSNQARLLATLYRDEKFYLAAKRATLAASDFALPACSMIYGVLSEYREKYGKMPSMSTLQDLIVEKAREDGEVDETLAKELCWVVDTMSGESVLDYKYACGKLIKFIESARVSRVAMNDPTNTERIKEAVKDVEEISIDGPDKRQVSLLEDCLELLPQSVEQVDVKIPTGLAWLDFVTNGGLSVTDHEIGVGMAGTGVGKALPDDDPIPTPEGWKKVGDIREGDFLFGANGKPVKVLKVHPQPEKKKVWVVEFVDGRKVRCCGEHNWEYWFEGHTGPTFTVATTSEILDHAKKRGGFRGHSGRSYRFRIKTCGPVEFASKYLPVDPYVVGAAIGNGCLSQWQFAISSPTSEVPEQVAACLGVKAVKTSKNNYSWIFETKNGRHLQNREVLVGSCKDHLLGKLSHEKSIPEEYLTACVSDRFRLLTGLLDTDGSISKSGGRISYSTTSPQLARDVVTLCNSLGMTAVAKAENRTDYKSGVCYNIRIQCKKLLKPSLFSVSDKHAKAVEYANSDKREEHKTMLAIANIEETEELADMTCFTVDAPDGLFLCNDYIVTHNTNMMINFAIAAAFAGFRVLFITLELTKKQIIRRAIGMMAHIRTGEMRKPVDQWSPASRKRLEFLMASKINSYIHVSEMADRSYAVSDLVGEIEKWKRRTREQTGDDSKCCLVIIDWLDMLVPEQKDMKLLGQEWQALKKVMEDVRHMANNQNVAVWTVMQTNRQGSGASKVRLDHVSGAFGKNFFASLVIGLAPVEGDSEESTINQDIRDEDLSKVKTECDRDLHINIIKNRDGVQREADIYQGPTLRFWKNKATWRTMEKMLEKGNMEDIFGSMNRGAAKT